MSEVKLERSLEQWRKCDPKAMATEQSPAAIGFAIADAKHDIAALAHERDTLSADNKRLREALQQIIDQYPNPDISHVDYRVHACKCAEQALASTSKEVQ